MDKNEQLLSADGTVKLTDWHSEPNLRTLKQELEDARPAHQIQMQRINRWNDLMMAKGAAKAAKVKGRSSVQPKLIRRQAEWRYSALSEPFLGSNKIFKLDPTTFEDEASAKQNELVINWQFRTKLNRVKLIDDYIRATVDEGTSILRVGWKRNVIQVNVPTPVFTHYPVQDEAAMQVLQAALQLAEEDPRGYDEQTDPAVKAAVDYYNEVQEATVAIQTGVQDVPTDKVLENRPTVEVMNPANVVIDPTCNGDFDKAMFAVVSFETNKAELLKDGDRYKNLDRVNWQGNSPVTSENHETDTPDNFNFGDSARKKVVAYEYWGFWDTKGDGTLTAIVCTWIGDVMIRMEENPFPDEKLPFVVVTYLPVKRGLFGEPDAELLEDNQKILGAVSRGMIDLLGRSANSQQGFAKGMLDPLNRRRYENGQDYEFNPNVSPNAGLIEHKYPELPQSGLMMLNLQNQEAEALTGVKSFGGGISGEAYGDVAAGIRGVLDAASKREMAILRRIAKGMADVALKITAMNAVFMSEKEIVRVTNKEFVEVFRDDLKGNFDLVVDISTAEIDAAKAEDLAFMLQTIGPKADPSMVTMILAEIADLKRMPALAEKLRRFQPAPPSEQEQERMRLEVEKLQAEVDKLKSEAALNNAKAAEAMAKKEMLDLDYVEQESGTKHAREMQILKAQSEGNQQLAVTKALTTPRKEGEKDPDIDAAIGYGAVSDKLNEGGQL
jgi:hypothetical protein